MAIDANERVGQLRQDQFAYEDERMLEVVLQGHSEMWAAMRERDAIYVDPRRVPRWLPLEESYRVRRVLTRGGIGD